MAGTGKVGGVGVCGWEHPIKHPFPIHDSDDSDIQAERPIFLEEGSLFPVPIFRLHNEEPLKRTTPLFESSESRGGTSV